MNLTAITTLLLMAGANADPLVDDGTTLRVAVFNIWELSSQKLNQVDEHGVGTNSQLGHAAEIVQRVRPDVLLVKEIDFDAESRLNAEWFRDRYLKRSQAGLKPVDFPYVFFEPVNTGLPSGQDLDHDGKPNGPADALGFGTYPGQYGMALFSRFPIDRDNARTFQKLLWQKMPGNLMPDGTNGKPAWYDTAQAKIMRLSSKSHWDVPIRIGDTTLHFLCCHPTPPVFDGPEDRNGRRTFDEVRLWADYISGPQKSSYITDDADKRGGLPLGESFVILGDLNAEPFRDPGPYGQPAIQQLLGHDRLRDPAPASKGAVEGEQAGPPTFRERRTSDFGRLDYVLPSKNLAVVQSGVFWPEKRDPLHHLVTNREASSDHRLVWVDIVAK